MPISAVTDLHATTAARAPLATAAIPAVAAFDASIADAKVVGAAIGAVDAVDALVCIGIANLAAAAIPGGFAFDTFSPSLIANLVPPAIGPPRAPPGRRTIGQRREPGQTEHATGDSLQHATTGGLCSYDTSDSIEATIVHDLLLLAQDPGGASQHDGT
jgi:hypothetical protein